MAFAGDDPAALDIETAETWIRQRRGASFYREPGVFGLDQPVLPVGREFDAHGGGVVRIDRAGIDQARAVDAQLRPLAEAQAIAAARRRGTLVRRVNDVRAVGADMHVEVGARRHEPSGTPDQRRLRIVDFGIVDGAARQRERTHPARAAGAQREPEPAVGAAHRAGQFRGRRTFDEQQVIGRRAVRETGGWCKRTHLQRERRETVVGDPGIVDARRTFGARSAQLQQQLVVEIAVDHALEAKARAPEIRAIAQVTSTVDVAIGSSADRTAAKIGVQRAGGILAVVRHIGLHQRAQRNRGAAVGARDRHAIVGDRHLRLILCGDLRLRRGLRKPVDLRLLLRHRRIGLGSLALPCLQCGDLRLLRRDLLLLRGQLRLLRIERLLQRRELLLHGGLRRGLQRSGRDQQRQGCPSAGLGNGIHIEYPLWFSAGR